ncbi:hypothetical protein HELRODRAFT_183679 [Helobdella robusta]|uniref:Uncharacterized protein n=1 Tax=Helobdella robusta TaxID=6412 RepID=T1FK10_HELRO|nr:hypothetical protein HELRODRAFT_183679 [Helobdella robusta]ESO10402.1 hypothetical protein HELRODRAFT_183679 [Helobdella robusta]
MSLAAAHVNLIKNEIVERGLFDVLPESKRESFIEYFLKEYEERITKSLFQEKDLDSKNFKSINENITSVVSCRRQVPMECVRRWRERCLLEEQHINHLVKSNCTPQPKITLPPPSMNDEISSDIAYYITEMNKLKRMNEKIGKKIEMVNEVTRQLASKDQHHFIHKVMMDSTLHQHF